MLDENYPQPQHYLLHISDTHFVGPDGKLYNEVDCDANLTALFDAFAKSNTRPEAILLTGDLADNGDPDAYRRIRRIVEDAAARYDAQVIWVMGNHDERIAFRTNLLDEPASTEPVDHVYDLDGLRVIALDSTVHGQHHGEITDAQLEWLSDVLATSAPHGTLLALHHPPLPSPIGLIRLVELREQERLAQVLQGTDVRAILAGHLHYSTSSTFAGIPVSVASATCYTEDLNAEHPTMRGQNGGQSFNLVHVYADRVMNSTVPIGDFPTLYEIGTEQLAALAGLDPDELLAAVADSLIH